MAKNRFEFEGFLTRDISRINDRLWKFGIAMDNSKKVNGEWVKDAVFFDCLVPQEKFTTMLDKGMFVFVSGEFRLDKWTSREGEKRETFVIWIDRYEQRPKPMKSAGNGQEAFVRQSKAFFDAKAQAPARHEEDEETPF